MDLEYEVVRVRREDSHLKLQANSKTLVIYYKQANTANMRTRNKSNNLQEENLVGKYFRHAAASCLLSVSVVSTIGCRSLGLTLHLDTDETE